MAAVIAAAAADRNARRTMYEEVIRLVYLKYTEERNRRCAFAGVVFVLVNKVKIIRQILFEYLENTKGNNYVLPLINYIHNMIGK